MHKSYHYSYICGMNREEKLGRADARRSKRERSAQARRERLQALHRKLLFRRGAAAAVAAVLLVVAGLRVYAALNPPGQAVPDMGRAHVPVGTSRTVSYNSDPPTSGPHYDNSAGPGIYDRPVEDGLLIHSLEHGYVIISYQCEGLSDAECRQLRSDLAEAAQRNRLWKLIVVPRPGMEQRIALTAWTRIDTMDRFDAGRIARFINAWRDKGPEVTMD